MMEIINSNFWNIGCVISFVIGSYMEFMLIIEDYNNFLILIKFILGHIVLIILR